MKLLLACVLALAPARDPDVVAGEAAYAEERWDDASVAFDAAWRRSGNPIFLYTRAQSERRAGRCEIAVGLYERFLTTSPPAEAGAAAQRYLDECLEQLAAAAPEPSLDPVPAPAVQGDAIAPPVTTTKRWSRDPAAAVLVAGGAAALVAGAALVGVAYRDVERAPDSADDRSYGDRVDRARRLEVAGATLLPIGAALVVGGAIRWGVLARRERRARVQLGLLGSPSPTHRVLGLRLSGRF